MRPLRAVARRELAARRLRRGRRCRSPATRVARRPRPRRQPRAPGRRPRPARRRSRRRRSAGRRLAHPQPPQLDGRIERAIAAARPRSASAGARSMSTSTFLRISRPAATRTSTATKSAAAGRPWDSPTGEQQPDEHRRRPGEVAAEVEAFACSAALPVLARPRAARRTPARVDRDHDREHDRDRVPGRVDLGSGSPSGAASAGTRSNRLGEHEDGRLARAARCSAFPCPYGWPRSAGRPATPTANRVSSAATRSVPECTASEISPRLPVASRSRA